MVPNKNKKHVDNDVLIKFAILSESLKKLYFNQLCYVAKSMENCYYGNICHPEQRYRRTDIWSTLLRWEKEWETTVLTISVILRKIENKMVFGQICYPEQKSGKRLFSSYFPH